MKKLPETNLPLVLSLPLQQACLSIYINTFQLICEDSKEYATVCQFDSLTPELATFEPVPHGKQARQSIGRIRHPFCQWHAPNAPVFQDTWHMLPEKWVTHSWNQGPSLAAVWNWAIHWFSEKN